MFLLNTFIRRTGTLALALLLVATVTALLIALQLGNAPISADAPAAGLHQPGRPAACDDESVRCEALGESGWAVIYESTDSADGLVMYDPGGPGLHPPSAFDVRRALPEWLQRYDIAILPEPWTFSPVTRQCKRVAAAFLSGTSPAAGVSLTCDWQGLAWTAEGYRSAVDELEHAVGPLTGVYARSFGATRVSAILPELERAGAWLLLDSPAPPAGYSGEALLRRRAEAVEDIVTSVPDCTEARPACSTQRKEVLVSLASGSDELGDGPLKTERDAMFGILGLAYDVGANEDWLARLWRGEVEMAGDDGRALRRSALEFARRMGDAEALPDLIGYWAGVCTTYDHWRPLVEEGPLAQALSHLHVPCLNGRASSWAPPAPVGTGVRTILVTNNRDPIVPSDLQSEWLNVIPSAEVTEFSYPGHVAPPPELWDEIERWVASLERAAPGEASKGE